MVLDAVIYDPYGNIVTETNASEGDRFKFAGMEYDSVTGLYYDHARYYDAAIGRFVGQDPDGFTAGDTNLFRYASNQPTIRADPSGLAPPIKLANPNTAKDNTYEGGIKFSDGRFYRTFDGSRWETWGWDPTGRFGIWSSTWGQPTGWPVQWLHQQPISPTSKFKKYYLEGFEIPVPPPPLPTSPTGKYLKGLLNPEPDAIIIA
jgi:RHS repeat-associated protein